jgi:hypothetical protein
MRVLPAIRQTDESLCVGQLAEYQVAGIASYSRPAIPASLFWLATPFQRSRHVVHEKCFVTGKDLAKQLKSV